MTQMAPAATNNNKNFRNMKAAMQAAVPAHNASTIGLRMCGDRVSTGISSQPTSVSACFQEFVVPRR